MTVDVDELVAEIRSGETERANDAIDRATEPDPAERFGWYGELIAACQPVFDSGDSDVREAVVRLLREAYPGLELRLGVDEAADVDGVRLEDTADHRHRYVEFLLGALDDPDSEVRRAAVEGVETLAPRLAAADLDAETEALRDALSELAVRQPEAKRRDTERAMRLVGRPELDEVMSDVKSRLERE